ncbi:MAG: polysaccharide biosynthesis/export family protein [Bacteroidota bacterium]|nr:polysaccharide biosynthesis/export family protein [Bacteroidota bacterium]
MYIRILMMFFIAALMTSCVSQKEVTYFQANDKNSDLQQQEIKEKFIARLQAGDILGIMVSSLSPEANAMFNPYPAALAGQIQNVSSNAPLPAIGFLVDETGEVALPLTGKIKVAGLSTKEATDLITNKLEQYLVQPTVNVRILNFKISILGEVARPSVYTIPNEKITLPEALSLAGDLTIFGKRNNILVIREIDGKREFARLDLTKRDFFNSPYYYLKANDVIYVEAGKGRYTATDRVVQLAPIFISALTLITVVSMNLLR